VTGVLVPVISATTMHEITGERLESLLETSVRQAGFRRGSVLSHF